MEIKLLNTPRPAVGLDWTTINVARDQRLVGTPVRVYDAAQRYDMPQSTLTRWANRGLLRILNRAPGILEVDEADVALTVALYRQLRAHTSAQQAGRWLDTLLA